MGNRTKRAVTGVTTPVNHTARTDAKPETLPNFCDEHTEQDALQLTPRQKRALRRRKNPLLATDLELDTPIALETNTGLTPILSDMSLGNLVNATRPLLIVSIGNPGAQYASTYHSAGHIVAGFLSQKKEQLPNTWSIRKSSVYMNVSGQDVGKILKKEKTSRLVILHDDLEREVGNIRVREGKSSAQGHNGIKSIQQSIPHTTDWWRIAIGVGRPNSRDQSAVSDYVLSKMKSQDMNLLRRSTDKVIEELGKLSEEG